jgi:hypothetical protein
VGSHLCLESSAPTKHHLTVPMHATLRVSTLAAIVTAVAQAQGIDRNTLLEHLFG